MPTEQSIEDRLIETLFARHSADGREVLIGPGDDAAMLRCPPGEQLLITADTLNEGVHFPAGTPAHSVGYRALAASLSDLAAMAARPLWAVVTLSVPDAQDEWLREFADGLYSLADGPGVRIVGGDFVRGPLSVTVAAHGAARQGAVLRRGGAGAGDGIWVSGFLGDAAAGLEVLMQRLGDPGERASRPPRTRDAFSSMQERPPSLRGTGESAEDALVRRFCYPQPRVELGRRLSGIASACMDLSDGLMTDLPRLLRHSGLQGRVEAGDLPVSGALQEFAGRDGSCRMALAGGDDYELCFTVPREREHRLKALSGELRLTRIGSLGEGEGLILTRGGTAWTPPDSGFRHFS